MVSFRLQASFASLVALAQVAASVNGASTRPVVESQVAAGPAAGQPDRCPGKPRDGAELAHGCSAIELVRRPDVLVHSLVRTLGDRAGEFNQVELLAPSAVALETAGNAYARAGRLLGQGEVCAASAESKRALTSLTQANAPLARSIDARAREVASNRAKHRSGDVSRDELQLAVLRLQQAQVLGVVADARTANAAFAALCSAIAGPLDIRGRVAQSDDAAGIVRLADGTAIGLAAKPYPAPAVPGTDVRARGVRFKDRTGIATVLDGASAKPGGAVARCLDLRIAPIQAMPPYHPGPQTLHYRAAYQAAGGTLQLEEGMRLGVTLLSCPGATPEGRALRYGMRIHVAQVGPGLESLESTVATDLREGEAPVALPVFLELEKEATTTSTVFRTSCKVLSKNPLIESCQPPEELTTATDTIVVRALGAYSRVIYDKAAFSVTDDGQVGDFEPAKVADVKLILAPAGAVFQAQGYKITNNASSYPQVVAIGLGDTFAVYSKDFYDPALPIPITVQRLLITGQERPSALRWARVVGTRNGRQFWYSTALPEIVHDLVATCPPVPSVVLPQGDPNPDADPGSGYPTFPPKAEYLVPAVDRAFYKLPFAPGVKPGNNGYLNIDDPNQGVRHPEWQAFALDLTAPLGTELRAARGGTVVFVVENDPYTLPNEKGEVPAGATPAPSGWTGIGNYVWVQHEDGSVAVYFHVGVNSVVPGSYQRVRRGEKLAAVDQTGGASGPHVHFQVVRVPPGVMLSPTTQIEARVLYQASTGKPAKLDSCYIPRSGESFASSNASPTPD